MKKIYTAILLFGLCGSAFAQDAGGDNTQMQDRPLQLMEQESERESQMQIPTSERGAVIWSEDFANGFNSTNGDWTVGGANGDVWKHATSIWSGCYAGGAQGALNFTTQANGFMLFHADSVNCVDPDATPNPIIEQVSLVGELISPSIDLSDHDAVSVNFQHHFRYCCQGMVLLLSVSSDGGATWTDYDVTAGTAGNVPNANTSPQVNISAAAAGESDVLLKFTWNSSNESSHYTWSIDDINLFVPVDYDLGMSDAGYNGFDLATSESYSDLAYGIYPISQLRNLVFKCNATNFGGMEQSDVQFRVTVTDEDMNETVLLSEMVTLPSGASEDIIIDSYTPPAEVGEYTVSFELISSADDVNPEDNVADDTSFRVSDSEYARDRFVRTGQMTNFDDNYVLGTMYFMENNEDIHCLGAGLSNASDPGTVFTMQILADNLDDFIAETLPLPVPPAAYLNAAGQGKITWQFTEFPVPVFAGDDIFIGVNHFGGDDQVVVANSGLSPAQTSFFYEGSEDTWYYVTATPMLRMGLSEEFCNSVVVVGVDEIDEVAVQELFPNPTEGFTTLSYTLLETSQVQIYLFDINGRVVMNQELGTQGVGEYRYEYDWSDQAAGMYTLSIHVNGEAINKKLVIK